jgi:hypothetical protein
MDDRRDIDTDCKEMFDDDEPLNEPNVINYEKKDMNRRKAVEIGKKTRKLR